MIDNQRQQLTESVKAIYYGFIRLMNHWNSFLRTCILKIITLKHYEIFILASLPSISL